MYFPIYPYIPLYTPIYPYTPIIPPPVQVIKNSKDFFDQSLDEIKLLQFINSRGDADDNHVRCFTISSHYTTLHHTTPHYTTFPYTPYTAYTPHNTTQVLRLIDFFYCKEHLFIVSELLKENLYEFGRFIKETDNDDYYTRPRLKRIMKQVLEALSFIHSLKLIHCDVKPENIVMKSFSRCEVKLIDFGSSCYNTDHLTTYIQVFSLYILYTLYAPISSLLSAFPLRQYAYSHLSRALVHSITHYPPPHPSFWTVK